MLITVLAEENQVTSLMKCGIAPRHEVVRVSAISELEDNASDLYIDLQFQHEPGRVAQLAKLLPAPVMINSVVTTLETVQKPFIRMNGWTGFLERPVTEIAIEGATDKASVLQLFEALNWKCSIVPDVPGMVSARVIAMIINEAYFALEQQVSSKQDIDTAMKLGTNYPFGPFEWSEKIGLHHIASLLITLSKTDERYQPSVLLLDEAAAGAAKNH